MFSRMNYANQFQPFGFGASQQPLGAAFGGINPLVPSMVPQLMNPYANVPLSAVTGVGAGLTPWGAPFSHALNPYSPQGLGHQFDIGAAQFGHPLNFVSNPYAQQPYGYTPYGYPGTQPGFSAQGFNGLVPSLFSTPTIGVEPLIAAAIAQQSQAPFQSPLPIRPLINPYQSDPLQVAAINQAGVPYQIGGLYGGPVSQSIDPSSILAQATLGHQTLKQQIGTPWAVNTGIPFWTTQQIPGVQAGYQACP